MAIPTDWQCLKCGSKDFEIGEVRTAGGFWSSFFDLGNRRFEYCSCKQCTYSSFIKAKSKVFRKFLTSLEAVRMAKLTNTEDWGKSFRSQVSIKTDNKFKVLNSRGKIRLQFL